MFFAKSMFRTKMVILAGLEAILGPLGTILSPLTPPAASEQSPVNASYFFFSLLKLPKPLLTSLHFSSLFLLRLGSLLGSILAASWAPILA